MLRSYQYNFYKMFGHTMVQCPTLHTCSFYATNFPSHLVIIPHSHPQFTSMVVHFLISLSLCLSLCPCLFVSLYFYFPFLSAHGL